MDWYAANEALNEGKKIKRSGWKNKYIKLEEKAKTVIGDKEMSVLYCFIFEEGKEKEEALDFWYLDETRKATDYEIVSNN